MKKVTLLFAATLVLVGISFAAPKDATYTGEIMDSHCAMMGNHGGKDAKTCTLGCVKGGSSFVLYDASSKAVYQLDDQTKPQSFAGQQVKVVGTLDPATKTIHVTDIQAGA
jgi:hypothetical protein